MPFAATCMELGATMLSGQTQKQEVKHFTLSRVGAKKWGNVDIKMEIPDTEDSKSGEGYRGMRVSKLPIEYNVRYLGDRCTRRPFPTITHVVAM